MKRIRWAQVIQSGVCSLFCVSHVGFCIFGTLESFWRGILDGDLTLKFFIIGQENSSKRSFSRQPFQPVPARLGGLILCKGAGRGE